MFKIRLYFHQRRPFSRPGRFAPILTNQVSFPTKLGTGSSKITLLKLKTHILLHELLSTAISER